MLNYLKKLEKFVNKLQQRYPASERGQSLVLVALFLFFAFLAFAALATDGTTLYLRRRQLQNMADAAALAAAVELSQANPTSVAYTAAMKSIASNEGQVEWYAPGGTANPPTSNVGMGSGLTAGIEIGPDNCTVRVALAWTDMGTYFAQFVGRDSLQVGANARAGCNRAGGLQPIAMKRFGDIYDIVEKKSDIKGKIKASDIYCETCNTRKQLNVVPPPGQGNGDAYDFFRPEAANADVIPEWPGFPNGKKLYETPIPSATNGNPGRKYYFLGSATTPNVGTSSWAGLVNLDIRIPSGSPVVQYFNGVTPGTGAATLKDMGEYYIRNGYCCDLPKPGDWVAMFSGTSASFSPQALQETYAEGDIIAILIYNGTVFRTPTVEMTGTPNYNITYPMTSTVTTDILTYTLTLEEPGPDYTFQSSPHGFNLNVEGLAGFADWGFSPVTPTLGYAGVTKRDIILTITPTVGTTMVGTKTVTHVITGTRMFYASAIDNKALGSGVRRYWAGVATIGDTVTDPISGTIQRVMPAVTGVPTNNAQNYPWSIVTKGKKGNYDIELNLWGGAADQIVDVDYVGTLPLPTGFSWGGGGSVDPWPGGTVAASGSPQTRVGIQVDVDNTASASPTTPVVPYVLPFKVTAATGLTSTFDIYVFVQEDDPAPADYVEILGYAAVRIDGYYTLAGNKIVPYYGPPSANSVRGHFVSGLESDPSNLITGLRARLIPWD